MLVNTPPMGWNSWNTFGTNISEDLIKETADVMDIWNTLKTTLLLNVGCSLTTAGLSVSAERTDASFPIPRSFRAE